MAQRGYALEDFQTVKDLGNGSFGVVKQVVHKETGETFAMKVLDKQRVVERGLEEQLKREVLIQLKARHPNVVRMHYYFEDPSRVRCLLEFADKGQLFAYLRRNVTGLPEPRAAQFFADSASGLAYLHSLGVAHRDIKPENILLFGENLRAKLGDLGWCVELTAERPDRQTFCGTTDYLSPEMVLNEPHDASVDLWALGVLLFEMLVARAPFAAPSQKEAIEKICAARVEIPARSMSEGPVELVEGLLRRHPRDRLSLSRVLAHPWVATLAGAAAPGATLDDTRVVERRGGARQEDLDGTVLVQRRRPPAGDDARRGGRHHPPDESHLEDTCIVERRGGAAKPAAPLQEEFEVRAMDGHGAAGGARLTGDRQKPATWGAPSGTNRRRWEGSGAAGSGLHRLRAEADDAEDAERMGGGRQGDSGRSSSSMHRGAGQRQTDEALEFVRCDPSPCRREWSIESQERYEEQLQQEQWLRQIQGRNGMGESRSVPHGSRPGEQPAVAPGMVCFPGARMKPAKTEPHDPIAERFARRDPHHQHRRDADGYPVGDDDDDGLGFQAAGGMVLDFLAGLFGGGAPPPMETPSRNRQKRRSRG